MIRLTLAPLPSHPWAVTCTPSAYDEAVKVQMAAIPGITWNATERHYVGAPDAFASVIATLKAARVASGGELPADGRTRYNRVTPQTHPNLRAYQHDGASWIVNQLLISRGGLLADEMGIGKTAQAITAAEALEYVADVDSCLVVCPAIVAPHWRQQIVKWGDDSGAREDGQAWLVLGYEAFNRAHKRGELPASQLLIVDECHYVSNPKAQRSSAVSAYAALYAPMILLLSGTPMTTRPRDLWAPLNLMHPGRWGSKFAFEKRYCNGRFEEIPGLDRAAWVADGTSHVEELAARLKAVMLRRTKSEVALELPARSRVVIDVEIPAKARKSLSAAARALDWKGNAAQGVGALLSQAEAYKVDAALSLARDCLANGSRPLIFTNRKATAEAIADELRCPCAHGDNSTPENRRDILLSGEGAAVSTIDSVTTGIDLVEFDTAIFTGLDWVPTKLLQAEARIHRLGQRRGVTIYFLVALGTIDEVVRERVIDRLETSATLFGGDESVMATELGGNDDDLLADLIEAIKEAA